jgi:hypothetical protein
VEEKREMLKSVGSWSVRVYCERYLKYCLFSFKTQLIEHLIIVNKGGLIQKPKKMPTNFP